MSVTSRLNKLEITAASIPRTVEQLVRDYENRVTDRQQDDWWFAGLSEAELKLLCAEWDSQFPHVRRFTAAEWARVGTMNTEEINQWIADDFPPLKQAL